MKKKTLHIAGAIVLALAMTVGSCLTSSGEGSGKSDSKIDRTTGAINNRPLNLSVYLDLSDRVIKGNGAVSQVENDKALINCIFDAFLEGARETYSKTKTISGYSSIRNPSRPT